MICSVHPVKRSPPSWAIGTAQATLRRFRERPSAHAHRRVGQGVAAAAATGTTRGHLDVAALGYPVLAFVYLHVAQGHLEAVVRNVGHIREVLEAHTIAGEGDIHCRVVARDNSHLEQVIQQLIDVRGVVRTKTEMALRQRLAPRILPLVMEPSDKLTSSIAANT
jgi:DNA-binding Lrp family transcriptional regulator